MPSDSLLQSLTGLQLCSEQQIKACEPNVRRLCHDLPDFDSVWLDALVQQRTLTAWQATILQSGNVQQLRVDEFLLSDQIGRHTYSATSVNTHAPAVVQHLNATLEHRVQQYLAQLVPLMEQLDTVRSSAPASLILPQRLVQDTESFEDSTNRRDHSASRESGNATSVSLVSRFAPGWSADDLLVRGGRLPWPVVAEAGRQLLLALRWLESHDLAHGEIVLRNVRLSPSGQTLLVAPFVRRLKDPYVSFSSDLQLRDVETTAPELVGSGREPDSRSEVYALGCVLWQMLTSRPVFLSADPVTKLMKSTECDVPDVRGLVPDCPDWMARLIHNFTRRSPDLRPGSLNEASQQWLKHSSDSTRQTRLLLKQMPDRRFRMTKPGSAPNSSLRNTLASTAVVLLMVTGFALYGIQRGLLPMPLRLPSPGTIAVPVSSLNNPSTDAVSAVPASESGVTAEVAKTADGLLLMPQPDAGGVVVLQSNGVYEAADLRFPGVMYIETSNNEPAIVLVGGVGSWNLQASQISLTNLQIQSRNDRPEGRSISALVQTECDVLSLTHCRVQSSGDSGLETCVQWKPSTGTAKVVTVSDCVFSGKGYGLRFEEPTERCTLNNVLFTNNVAAVRCDLKDIGRVQPVLTLTRVTSVHGVSFLDVVSEHAKTAELRIQIPCGESVLVPTLALVRLALPEDFPLNGIRTEFLLPERGNPTIVATNINPVVYFDRSLKQLVQLPETQLVMESLLIAQPVFRGSGPGESSSVEQALTSVAAMELVDFEGPKLSTTMPGIDATRLFDSLSVSIGLQE